MADPAGGSVLRNQWHRPVEHVSEGQCSLRPKNAIGLKRGADDYKFHKPSKLAARDRKVCATRRPQAAPAGGGRGQGINGSQPDANRAEVVTAGTSNRGCDDAGSGRLPEGCTFLPVDIASLPERLCKVLRLYSELLNDWTVGVQLCYVARPSGGSDVPYTDLCVMLLPVPLYSGQLEVDRQLSCCLMCTVAPWRHAVTDPWPRLMHPKDLATGHLHLQGEQQLQGMCVLMTRREQQSQHSSVEWQLHGVPLHKFFSQHVCAQPVASYWQVPRVQRTEAAAAAAPWLGTQLRAAVEQPPPNMTRTQLDSTIYAQLCVFLEMNEPFRKLVQGAAMLAHEQKDRAVRCALQTSVGERADALLQQIHAMAQRHSSLLSPDAGPSTAGMQQAGGDSPTVIHATQWPQGSLHLAALQQLHQRTGPCSSGRQQRMGAHLEQGPSPTLPAPQRQQQQQRAGNADSLMHKVPGTGDGSSALAAALPPSLLVACHGNAPLHMAGAAGLSLQHMVQVTTPDAHIEHAATADGTLGSLGAAAGSALQTPPTHQAKMEWQGEDDGMYDNPGLASGSVSPARTPGATQSLTQPPGDSPMADVLQQLLQLQPPQQQQQQQQHELIIEAGVEEGQGDAPLHGKESTVPAVETLVEKAHTRRALFGPGEVEPQSVQPAEAQHAGSAAGPAPEPYTTGLAGRDGVTACEGIMQRSPPFDSHMHPHPHLMSASQPMGAMKQQQMGVHQQEGEQALAQPLCHLAGTSSTQHMQAPVSTSLQAGSSPGMHTPSVNGRQGSSLTDAGSMPLSQIQMAQYQETPFAVRVYRGDFGPSPNSTASAPPTATATAAAHTTAGGSQGSPAVCVTAPAAQPVGAVGSRGGDRSPAMLGQRQEQPQREQQGQPERDRSRGAQSTLCEAADPVEQPPEDAGGHEHAASREGVQPSTAVTGPGSQVDAHVMMLVNTTVARAWSLSFGMNEDQLLELCQMPTTMQELAAAAGFKARAQRMLQMQVSMLLALVQQKHDGPVGPAAMHVLICLTSVFRSLVLAHTCTPERWRKLRDRFVVLVRFPMARHTPTGRQAVDGAAPPAAEKAQGQQAWQAGSVASYESQLLACRHEWEGNLVSRLDQWTTEAGCTVSQWQVPSHAAAVAPDAVAALGACQISPAGMHMDRQAAGDHAGSTGDSNSKHQQVTRVGHGSVGATRNGCSGGVTAIATAQANAHTEPSTHANAHSNGAVGGRDSKRGDGGGCRDGSGHAPVSKCSACGAPGADAGPGGSALPHKRQCQRGAEAGREGGGQGQRQSSSMVPAAGGPGADTGSGGPTGHGDAGGIDSQPGCRLAPYADRKMGLRKSRHERKRMKKGLEDDEKPSQPVVNPANKLHPGPAHVASSEAGLEEVAQRYQRAAEAAGKQMAVAASCAEALATAHTEPASASAHLSGFTAALQAARRAVSELELLVQQSASAAAKANLMPA